mgnify:CR=1 FL=1
MLSHRPLPKNLVLLLERTGGSLQTRTLRRHPLKSPTGFIASPLNSITLFFHLLISSFTRLWRRCGSSHPLVREASITHCCVVHVHSGTGYIDVCAARSFPTRPATRLRPATLEESNCLHRKKPEKFRFLLIGFRLRHQILILCFVVKYFLVIGHSSKYINTLCIY